MLLCSVHVSVLTLNEIKALFFIQAAATTCYVAVHPAVAGVSGKYFADCNEASPSRLGASSEEASRLWTFSENITAEKVQKTSSVHVVSTGLFRLQAQSSNADRAMTLAV
jgi:hypothetical protein